MRVASKIQQSAPAEGGAARGALLLVLVVVAVVGSFVVGDVITAVDGEKVKSLDTLLEALERRQPGDVVRLAVWRAGATSEIQAKLGKPE